jgi:hypothetical protein
VLRYAGGPVLGGVALALRALPQVFAHAALLRLVIGAVVMLFVVVPGNGALWMLLPVAKQWAGDPRVTQAISAVEIIAKVVAMTLLNAFVVVYDACLYRRLQTGVTLRP